MAKYLMVQGTTSNAGKTTICAGLCRILQEDGYKVTPFKAQNMGLNSFFDEDGHEMGYGQALQAYAAKIEPKALMNPLLLKPKGQGEMDVIVNGVLDKTLSGNEFAQQKGEFFEKTLESLQQLERDYDVIVIEGAGSPAEINMSKPDIANMGLASVLKAPVIMVGNIELGGVFASLYGTFGLLEQEEQELVKGFIINKLSGYASLLENGIEKLEALLEIPSLGIVPRMSLDLEDEDMPLIKNKAKNLLKLGVINSAYATNLNIFRHFNDFDNVGVDIVVRDWHDYSVLIIPSTNNLEIEKQWYYENVTFDKQVIITYGNGRELFKQLDLNNEVYHIEEQTLVKTSNDVIAFVLNRLTLDNEQFFKTRNLAKEREQELIRLAQHLRSHLDLAFIYELLEN